MGVSDEPSDERELVADAAIDKIRRDLTQLGLTARVIIVSFVVEEESEHGNNATSGAWSEDDFSERDIFDFFLNHTISYGREIGLTLVAVPLPRPIGHD